MYGNPSSQKKRFALGRLKAGTMNSMEAKYAEHLATLQIAGDVLFYKFEGIKLRLAENCFYTPDFLVQTADEVIELHECKGMWMGDARVKIKVAAAMYPFRFIAVRPRPKKHGGGWSREEF